MIVFFSPQVRISCREPIDKIGNMMDECQEYGNYNEDAFCEQVCEECPSSAFFYSPDFFADENCLAT